MVGSGSAGNGGTLDTNAGRSKRPAHLPQEVGGMWAITMQAERVALDEEQVSALCADTAFAD